MYNRKDVLKNLHEYNYFIDELALNNFIKNWKIDPIYEDEDGIEFYDNLALIKLKKGISLKSQGFSNEQIIYHINKILPEKLQGEKEAERKELPVEQVSTSSELKNVTIDVTSQTLQMLADTVAGKITADIKEQIQNADFVKQILQRGSLKEDNESLSKQVEELLEDNKKLAQRVEELENCKRIFPFDFKHLRKFLN